MVISDFFVEEGNAVFFSEEQASLFAKSVAGDFNPIHDPGSKRFCVPGDLLFSVLLNRYGVAARTSVEFSGMLSGGTRMVLPDQPTGEMNIVDASDKALLTVKQAGQRFINQNFTTMLSAEYVKFSGQTFPGILVQLMRDAQVMINPARPLVIYKDMTIAFNEHANALFQATDSDVLSDLLKPMDNRLTLRSTNNSIDAEGRKGRVTLSFAIEADGIEIGTGEKNMLLSGLREYEESAMMEIVDQYNAWRRDYLAA